ncbi:flagellar motor switch protein FliN [Sphaerotilus sp.]|uniref:flagellar motor switch protein FliN n=1 Tax=Sphaerotilus sp. TaxID=2093942 RepID=UPI00286E9D32|nr:flagellar motor switch protein FliN [Sphaerotilus sp.]
MSENVQSGLSEQDALAAEWAAALDESSQTPDVGSSVDALSGYGSGLPQAAAFTDFGSSGDLSGGASGGKDLNLILDIPVQLTVELGRTRIPIKNILHLAQGSVVELDAMAGEPMDVLVNGYLIAQGEVVVVNEKFGVRLTDIVTPSERMRRLSRGN